MQFDEREYELVEKILLGDSKFNELQREYIELFETKTIVAGPGAGKTTALAAKIVLLLKYLNKIGSKDGVCIITYTNVAVTEINMTLQKAGIASLSHPHFIGTIHEFFNKYCVTPYFKKEYKNNVLIFDNEHKDDTEFYKSFISRKLPWINADKFERFRDSFPHKIYNSKLVINDIQGEINIENTTNWDKFDKYKNLMLEAKIKRKMQGVLTHDDTFLFSKMYLSNPIYVEMLRNRFKYIFIDEFQDTTPVGIELLRGIFDFEGNCLQMIGDPYQTIMYGQPMPMVDESQVFRLNISNRFGPQISKPLNVIMPEANIHTSDNKNSFAPVLLIYNDEKSIYTAYKEIIKEYEQQENTFQTCIMSDKVLVLERKWASIIKEGAEYNKKKSKKLETIANQLKRLVIEFICKRIKNDNETLTELKKWINKHQNIMVLNKILLDFLKFGIAEEKKQRLRGFINDLLMEKGERCININNEIFREIEDIFVNSNIREESEPESIDDIFTIHSVKGETLRSALVVNFNDGPLTDILLHRYSILEDAHYQYTDCNLLYVAISRVAYLLVFAIHKDVCTDDVREKLNDDWVIREI
ncbi:UvrD-helicase domain-containing protein [Peribacillus frigoritolerans]|uniref:UvrD-helicase domain-containing protein n=1 Tax=Peribacillus frigoritolerans TaxID=450367 RepID=UPI00227F2189|nr:UvrD-helicase domain-containing protein [Peribacillus frigoritolerans]MCY9004625.1 UvrD-helicase domain-containing protein [Peribacillus frigoritolerans]